MSEHIPLFFPLCFFSTVTTKFLSLMPGHRRGCGERCMNLVLLSYELELKPPTQV